MNWINYHDTFRWIENNHAQADVKWINGHRRIYVFVEQLGGYVVDDQINHDPAFVFRAIVLAILRDPLGGHVQGKVVQWNPGCNYAV